MKTRKRETLPQNTWIEEIRFDRKAAGERQNGGNIMISLEANKKRYNISDQLYSILNNTVQRYLR